MKALTEQEMQEFTKGREAEVVMEFHFIKEKGGTVAIIHLKKGLFDKYHTYAMHDLVETTGRCVDLLIQDQEGLLPRKEDIARA